LGRRQRSRTLLWQNIWGRKSRIKGIAAAKHNLTKSALVTDPQALAKPEKKEKIA